MRNNGSYHSDPSLRKPSMKKRPLMKKSLEQLKKTQEFYRVSMPNTYHRQGDDNVFRRDARHVMVVPHTNKWICPSRPSNGMQSLRENIEESMPSSSRVAQKIIELSRPSFLKSPSPRPNNGMDSPNKSTNGGAPLLKNVDKPRTSSTTLNNGEASPSKNTEMPRSSSLRSNNAMVSPPMNIENPNNGLAPLGRNNVIPLGRDNKLLKSRPSRLKNGFSSVSKDDSNSIFRISKESHSSIFGNSRISAQNVNIEAQKEDTSAAIKAWNLSLELKGNQAAEANMRIHHDSLLSKNLSSCQTAKVSCMVKERHVKSMDKRIQLGRRKPNIGLPEDGGTNDDKLKSMQMEPLFEKIETHEDDDSDLEIRRSKKKRRRLILIDYEDDDDDDRDLRGVEIGTTGLTTQTDIVKDCSIEASNAFMSKSLKFKQYGSLPIDEPVWSGIIKMNSRKNVSLAAHLSTKCCEEVWNLAGSLQQEIIVTKLSRMKAWPKSFEAARPTDNNIALYFLPCEMREDADLDQLVKEVVENDMVLQAVIGEAEMLIFPSILLPEEHQTFQGKPYLWAVFKRRKNKIATVEAQIHGKGGCPQDEMGQQQASNCSHGKEVHRVTALNMDGGVEAPDEVERQGMEREQNPAVAGTNASSPAAKAPTMDATMSENHGHPSLAVPTGAVFGFVVQRNHRTEQLLRAMQLEGAVVVAMQGEMIGSGLGQATATGREENEMPPSSTGRVSMV